LDSQGALREHRGFRDAMLSKIWSMRISYTEHATNDEVLRRVGLNRRLMAQVKSRKLKYFGHVTRYNSMEKDIMLGI